MSERVDSDRARALLNAALIVLGLTVTSGWVLQVPLLIGLWIGSVPLVFNTGLCFALAGLMLSALGRRGAIAISVRRGIGVAILALAVVTLGEIALDRSLGVDLAWLHGWFDQDTVRPGRMAPNTALGFLLIASVALLAERVDSKRRAIVIVVLTFTLLAIGLTGLASYVLAPDLLFGWSRNARMAVPTAIGMIACACSLALAWAHSDWYASRRFFREDEKIRLLSSATVFVVTITAGLTGFVLLQDSLVHALERSFEAIVLDRRPWMGAVVDELASQSKAAIELAGLEDTARVALQAPSAQASERLRAGVERLVGHPFRGIAIADDGGRVMLTVGRFAANPAIVAALKPLGDRALVWDDAMLLRLHFDLTDRERVVGRILVDQEASGLEASLFDASSVGRGGEINACIARDRKILCFPGSAHAAPFSTNPSRNAPYPMERALAGGSGVVHAVDYRGADVIAAFTSLALGLGFVVKQPTTEAYASIRQALWAGTPIVLAIAVAGATLLYWQLSPLARSLWRSERRATASELKGRAIMNATDDGILTIDRHGILQDVNPAICRLFGRDATALVGTHFAALIPRSERRTHLRRLLRTLRRGNAAAGASTSTLDLVAERADGSVFPIELSLNEVALPDANLVVGVLRDVTLRKDMERSLVALAQFDPLTGLPNRALFLDRLGSALSRSDRARDAFAVIFLDLDGFKRVNDTHGHQAGDELLVQVAQRLLATVRKSDTVARLAGDEFMVILERLARPDTDAEEVARKIVETIRRPFDIVGGTVRVTASAGVVIRRPGDDETDVAELLRRADQQMYAAKRGGKDAFSIAPGGAVG